jgi:hypothetical protein
MLLCLCLSDDSGWVLLALSGRVVVEDGVGIELNVGRALVEVTVTNKGDRPIQVAILGLFRAIWGDFRAIQGYLGRF